MYMYVHVCVCACVYVSLYRAANLKHLLKLVKKTNLYDMIHSCKIIPFSVFIHVCVKRYVRNDHHSVLMRPNSV